MTRARALLPLLALLWMAVPADAATKVDYGPISHKGLKKLGGISKEQEAHPPARPDREPVGAPEGGQGSLRSELRLVRQVSVTVHAPGRAGLSTVIRIG
jgi:hypothetical protein